MESTLGKLPEDEKPPWVNYKLFNSIPIQSYSLNLLQFPNVRQIMLEELRNKISTYENTNIFINDNWEYYKKVANPYELVYTQTKYSNFPASVSILKPLSRSYFKMIEIIEVFRFFDKHKGEFLPSGLRTAHACEGPGGFIEAIFERAEKNKVRIQESTAITLRSIHSNVPGWRRASNFLSRNKQINIIYGEDKTGDILKRENQDSFINSVISKGGKVHLYTADGGLDFSDNYENQEDKIFPILLASAYMGIACLKKGGMLVLKFFDVQNENTKQLIFLLQTCFSSWTLYKPAMSRPCNPEQYFVGVNFKHGYGTEEPILNIFQTWLKMPPGLFLPFPTGAPSDFIHILNFIQNSLIEYQIKYLNFIFEIIKITHKKYNETGQTTNEFITSILKINEKKSYEWCIKFMIPRRLLSS